MEDIVEKINIKYQSMLKRDHYDKINNYGKFIIKHNSYMQFSEKYNITNVSKKQILYTQEMNIPQYRFFFNIYLGIYKGFNNLSIHIYNPSQLKLNELIDHFEFICGGSSFVVIKGDFETHIDVLKHFFDSKYQHNEETQYTEISLGIFLSG